MTNGSDIPCDAPDCERHGCWPLGFVAKGHDDEVLGEFERRYCDTHVLDAVGWSEQADGTIDYVIEGEFPVGNGLWSEFRRWPRGDGVDRVEIAGEPVANTLPTLTKDELLDKVADMLGVQRPEEAS